MIKKIDARIAELEAEEEKKKKYKFLDTYCRNLTKRAEDGKLDRIVGRDKELARVIQILCRRQKNFLFPVKMMARHCSCWQMLFRKMT